MKKASKKATQEYVHVKMAYEDLPSPTSFGPTEEDIKAWEKDYPGLEYGVEPIELYEYIQNRNNK